MEKPVALLLGRIYDGAVALEITGRFIERPKKITHLRLLSLANALRPANFR